MNMREILAGAVCDHVTVLCVPFVAPVDESIFPCCIGRCLETNIVLCSMLSSILYHG